LNFFFSVTEFYSRYTAPRITAIKDQKLLRPCS